MVKYETLADNKNLVRAYSDKGMKIHGGEPEADYDEAIDPVDMGRIYKETDIPVGSTSDDDGSAVSDNDDNSDEATIIDYINALKSLGVNVDEKDNT